MPEPTERRRAALLKARQARLKPSPTRIKQVAVGQANRDRYRRKEAS